MNLNNIFEINESNKNNILADLSVSNVLKMVSDSDTIWHNLNSDKKLVEFCKNLMDEDEDTARKKLCLFHPDFKITVLQWLLWYVGSGIRAYMQTSKGFYSRKDWAFHKISLIKMHTPPHLWKELVHTQTGFEKKCSTIHFFCRHAYVVKKLQLDYINKWLDDCNGRFKYSHCLDEYGYEPGDYVNFHRKRQQIFKKKCKKEVDMLVKKYHHLEDKIKSRWETGKNYLNTNKDNYWEWLKEVSNNGEEFLYKIPEVMRKELYDAAIARINSYLIHKGLFQDELSFIEKEEEKKGRGFSQMSNHLWIIKTYYLILIGTKEGKSLAEFAKLKKIDI